MSALPISVDSRYVCMYIRIKPLTNRNISVRCMRAVSPPLSLLYLLRFFVFLYFVLHFVVVIVASVMRFILCWQPDSCR